MATPPPVHIMQGGAKSILIDFSKKQAFYVEILFVSLLVLGIVFPKSISSTTVRQLSTIPGRALMFGLLVATLMYTNWVYGVLLAVLIALILSRRSVRENFVDTFDMVDTSNIWFVEKLLKENPIAINQTKVTTIPVQEDEENKNTQDTKSSSK